MLRDLFQNIQGLVDTKSELAKIEIAEILAQLASKLIYGFFLSIFIFFIVAFASVSLGNYLNNLLSSNFGGYLLLAGVYLILTILLAWLNKKKKITFALQSYFLKNIHLPVE